MSIVVRRSLIRVCGVKSQLVTLSKCQINQCKTSVVFSRHFAASASTLRATKVNVQELDTKVVDAKYTDGFVSPKEYPPLDSKTETEYYKDFKVYLNTQVKSDAELIDDRFKGVPEEKKPLVIIFGWAGANGKNIGKYANLYENIGCITLSYNLPTRFILELTSQTPYLTDRLVSEMEDHGLLDRPVIIHSLSDTGMMAYQGLQLSLKHRNKSLDIRGMVLDSCPGERPELNVPKLMALIIVKWVCSRRDKMSYAATIVDEIRFMKERVWPAALNLMKGKKPEISVMDNLWCGDVVRLASPEHKWPELFLYSKTDFYLNYKYVEKMVIDKHVKDGRDVYTKRWDKSPHVCHLKSHKKSYMESLYNFIDTVYFSQIRK